MVEMTLGSRGRAEHVLLEDVVHAVALMQTHVEDVREAGRQHVLLVLPPVHGEWRWRRVCAPGERGLDGLDPVDDGRVRQQNLWLGGSARIAGVWRGLAPLSMRERTTAELCLRLPNTKKKGQRRG